MQQLQSQLPTPKLPSTPLNNVQHTSSVNKAILPPNVPNTVAAPITVAKTELPQISPTGNNNKSNINLNHLTQNNQQQHQMMQQQIPNPSQASSMINMNIIPNVTQGQSVVNMMSSVPQASSMLAQQAAANALSLNQMKHQAQFGMNPFIDPLEQTLASLEQPSINNQKNNAQQDMNAMLMDLQNQKMMLNQIAGPNPNGFGDFNGVNGVNQLMNMLAMPQMDPQRFNNQMKQNRPFVDNPWPPNNAMMKQNSSQSNVPMQHPSQQQQQQQQQMQLQPPALPQQQQQQQQPPPPLPSPKAAMKDKIMLTPKPIEELMNNPNERTKSMGGSSSFGSSFSKSEQNLKNASSWSQLGAGSPQNMGTPNTSTTKTKVPSTDTFQEYKTKAKEQIIQRQRQEQEKMKKQKEQELKRQQESLQKQKISEDMSNGHK